MKNKKIIAFNTANGSCNMGDYIIAECVEKELSYIYKDSFVVNLPTHTPVCHFYQYFKNKGPFSYTNKSDLKFIYGTNLIKKNMLSPFVGWNVNIFNYKPYKESILVGVGLDGNFKKTNFYTKALYKKILSDKYIHSTRDEKTKNFLESLGLKAINTGCATLWSLNSKKCNTIPEKKSKDVVFTLTDYCKDVKKDQQLINILTNNYKNIYFWVQGYEDLEYLNGFKNIKNIKLVFGLEDYRNLLQKGNIDYVGTRLHAGIFAMKNSVRTIILIIDNRARDMKQSYNLPSIERNDIDMLDSMINSSFKTDIKLDEKRIKEWKNQFNKGSDNNE